MTTEREGEKVSRSLIILYEKEHQIISESSESVWDRRKAMVEALGRLGAYKS